jgi:hypothetical protein
VIAIDDILISEEVLEKRFVCDLAACKGACCVEGESGAPLEVEEVALLEEILPRVQPYMRPEGIQAVQEQGAAVVDSDGDFVTPLVKDGECAFVHFDHQGIAMCAIEMAYREGKIDFQKPISCHLYPIRLSKLKDFMAVNYHHWHICDPARNCGAQLNVKVYRFLRGPLVRLFGESFYEQLEAADAHLSKEVGERE